MDDDHIAGLLDMTDRMERRDDQGLQPRYEIDGIWFNAFDDIVGNVEIAAFRPGAAGVASLPGRLQSSGAIIASVGQGRTLRDRSRRLGLAVNDGDGLITDGFEWDMGDGLTFLIVGPSRTRIDEFQAEWDAKVRENGWDTNADPAGVAAFLDKSPSNLASLVVLARRGGKSMLLTGDARGDDILTGLEETGELAPGGSMTVDILKIPHHGSDRNVSTDFFRRVKARSYVVSGNGKHKNPDIATLEMILEARESDDYTVHATYRKGIDGHEGRMDRFLDRLSASDRTKFVFRGENDVGMKIDLQSPFDAT